MGISVRNIFNGALLGFHVAFFQEKKMAVDLREMIHCSSEVETMISVDADVDAVIATGPVVTTLIDVLGVLVYLSVAKLLLQL